VFVTFYWYLLSEIFKILPANRDHMAAAAKVGAAAAGLAKSQAVQS
jgi:hypothetical protein